MWHRIELWKVNACDERRTLKDNVSESGGTKKELVFCLWMADRLACGEQGKRPIAKSWQFSSSAVAMRPRAAQHPLVDGILLGPSSSAPIGGHDGPRKKDRSPLQCHPSHLSLPDRHPPIVEFDSPVGRRLLVVPGDIEIE